MCHILVNFLYLTVMSTVCYAAEIRRQEILALYDLPLGTETRNKIHLIEKNVMVHHANGFFFLEQADLHRKVSCELSNESQQKDNFLYLNETSAFYCGVKHKGQNRSEFLECQREMLDCINETLVNGSIHRTTKLLRLAKKHIVVGSNFEAAYMLGNELSNQQSEEITVVSRNCDGGNSSVRTYDFSMVATIGGLKLKKSVSYPPGTTGIVYAFQHADEFFFITLNNELDSKLMQLRNVNGNYDWTSVAELSCTGKDGTVFRRANAAVLLGKGSLGNLLTHKPEEMLYVSFFQEVVLDPSLSTSVICRYPISDAYQETLINRVGGWKKEALAYFRETKFTALSGTIIEGRPVLITQEKYRIQLLSTANHRHPHPPANFELVLSNGKNSGLLENVSSVVVSESGEELFVLTQRRVLKLDINRCARFKNCSDCTKMDDIYCGWCVLENRCSPFSVCSSAFDPVSKIERKLWLKDFTSRPDQCPSIHFEDKQYYAIDSPTWASEDIKIEFLVSNIPLTGTYLVDMRCEYRYGQINTFDVTPAVLKPQSGNVPPRFACVQPAGLVGKAIKAHSNSSTHISVYVSLGLRRSTVERSLAETHIYFIDCSSLSTCQNCKKTNCICAWSFENSKCSTYDGISTARSFNKTGAEEHCSSKDRSLASLLNLPKFNFNHPKITTNASVIEILFSGDHFHQFQESFRDLRIRIGESQCFITYLDNHALSCEIRNANWTGLAEISISSSNGLIPCRNCFFKLLPTLKTHVYISSPSAEPAEAKTDWIIVLIPALTGAILLCVILTFQMKLRSATKQTYESLVQVRRRFLIRRSQEHPSTVFIPQQNDGRLPLQHNGSAVSHGESYRSVLPEKPETDEEHFYFEITERVDSSPAETGSGCYEIPIAFQRVSGINVKCLETAKDFAQTPYLSRPLPCC